MNVSFTVPCLSPFQCSVAPNAPINATPRIRMAHVRHSARGRGPRFWPWPHPILAVELNQEITVRKTTFLGDSHVERTRKPGCTGTLEFGDSGMQKETG